MNFSVLNNSALNSVKSSITVTCREPVLSSSADWSADSAPSADWVSVPAPSWAVDTTWQDSLRLKPAIFQHLKK